MDGKYLATGCGLTAQIYDTKTIQKNLVSIFLSFPLFSTFFLAVPLSFPPMTYTFTEHFSLSHSVLADDSAGDLLVYQKCLFWS